jgi:hypothetical protein
MMVYVEELATDDFIDFFAVSISAEDDDND